MGNYFYGNLGNGDYAKERNFNSKIFVEGVYYLTDKFYTTLSSGNLFGTTATESSPNVILFNKAGRSSTNYLWGGIGYGRLINTGSYSKEYNFEEILKDQNITKNLSPSGKVKILKLIERRNNKDFISKYRDNADAEFFREIEKVLKEDGIIDENLGAETTIKLYQTLLNERYINYPNYSGFQAQSEIQLQLNDNYFNHFLTTGVIYGHPLSPKSTLLFSGFLSIPLNENSNAEGLFNYFKDPFSNYLPVIVEEFKLDNTNYLSNREFYYEIGKNRSFYVGGKAILFQRLNPFAGIRPYISAIIDKPASSDENILANVGVVLDYNIFSRLTLNLRTEYTITNEFYPDFYYNLGFLWNVL